jgi:hypothetical protein
MAVKLRQSSYDHAKALIEEGRTVLDERDDWSEHQPSADEENAFIEKHSWNEFANWHLAIDDEAREETKEHYKFPYGDFHDVHRCAVLSAESRAGQYHYDDVEAAAAHLHGMLEAVKARA